MIQKLSAEFGENVNERLKKSKYEIENNVDEDDAIDNNNYNNNG